MRLIDADALREQTVKDAEYAKKNGFLDLQFEREWLVERIDRQPTVCDIEQIRTEIYQLHCHPKLDFIKTDDVVDMALDIIDKYK